jgi:N-methylhydantoinase A
MPGAAGKESKPSSVRSCFFGGSAPLKTAVFKPSDIHPGNVIAGPAIVEEPTTTLVIYPGMSAQVSGFGNYLLRVG